MSRPIDPEAGDEATVFQGDQNGFPGYLAQESYAIRFGWGPAAAAALVPGTDLAVVVDVLSFTTAAEVATTAGAVVFPSPVGSAAELAATQGAVLARPRAEGGPSLSPASLLEVRPGTRIVLASPNGAETALVASGSGASVVAGCLRNADAVARLASSFSTMVVIAAGERWPDGSLRPALEDIIGAGAVLTALDQQAMAPEARAAAAIFQWAEPDLLRILRESTSGRELVETGFGEDVVIAAHLNASATVPMLRDGAFTAVS